MDEAADVDCDDGVVSVGLKVDWAEVVLMEGSDEEVLMVVVNCGVMVEDQHFVEEMMMETVESKMGIPTAARCR